MEYRHLGIRKSLGKFTRAALAPFDLDITRIQPAEPEFQPIKIFELCAIDLMRRVPEPFVLQIGANDGVRFDPVRPFVTQNNWRGLMIEPHPIVYEDLTKNYRDFPAIRTLNAAIGSEDGTLNLYTPSNEIIVRNPDLSGLCSLNKNVLISTMMYSKIDNPADHIQTVPVKALSVSSLLEDQAIMAVDVLQIDTEGHDWKILSQFDLNKLGVSLVNMEFNHLRPDEKAACISFLDRSGFSLSRYHLDLVAYKS